MPRFRDMAFFPRISKISRVWVGDMWPPLIRHRRIRVSGKLRLEKVIMNVLFHFKAFLCPVQEIWPFFRENPRFQECEWVTCVHFFLKLHISHIWPSRGFWTQKKSWKCQQFSQKKKKIGHYFFWTQKALIHPENE